MKDYYSEFAKLCLQQNTYQHKTSKRNIDKHNRSFTQLYILQEEMKQFDCTDILLRLLNHNDYRVQTSSATFCLKLQILVEEAISVLKNVINDTPDRIQRFSAQMVLYNYLKTGNIADPGDSFNLLTSTECEKTTD